MPDIKPKSLGNCSWNILHSHVILQLLVICTNEFENIALEFDRGFAVSVWSWFIQCMLLFVRQWPCWVLFWYPIWLGTKWFHELQADSICTLHQQNFNTGIWRVEINYRTCHSLTDVYHTSMYHCFQDLTLTRKNPMLRAYKLLYGSMPFLMWNFACQFSLLLAGISKERSKLQTF